MKITIYIPDELAGDAAAVSARAGVVAPTWSETVQIGLVLQTMLAPRTLRRAQRRLERDYVQRGRRPTAG